MKNLRIKPLAIAVSVAVAGLGQPVFAADDSEKVIEEVTTIGSRSGKPRSATDSPVAVDVISGDQFTSLGNAADITDNLKSLIPSYSATPATGDGSAFIRPTSLRGMAPDQSLVLVNGKRRHRSALVQFFAPAAGNGAHGVDIGMIPSISLKSVEVLRDGAAAQYGSDAIAGVMNFVLKDANSGGKVLAQYGEFFEGEQSFMVAANGGFNLGENGFINLSIETNDNDALSRGIQRPNAQALIDDGVQGVGADAPFGDAPLAQSWGRPETSGTRLALNSGIDLSDDMELYLHGMYAETEGRYRFFYRDPGHDTLVDVTTLPAGYTPFLDGDQTDYSMVTGLKGEFGNEMFYDISVGIGKSELEYLLNNTVNSGLVDAVAGTPGQRDFNMGGYEQEEVNFNADFSKTLSDDLNLAFGAEWREETFTTLAGEEAAYLTGSPSGMSSVTPADAGEFDRDNFAVYVDVEQDISEEWLMQYALRYEDFSDFGDTTNGKVATRFRVNDNFTLRGAVSTGFHAPTPGQANISSIITTFDGSGNQQEEGQVPPTSDLAVAYGGAPLTEEKSLNLSVGFTSSYGENTTLTVDLYKVEVDDRIYRTGNIPLDPADPDGPTVSFYTNTLDVEHQGLDLVLTTAYDWNDEVSTEFSFAYNFNEIEVTGQALVNGVQPVSDSLVEDIENNYPENRFVLSALTDIGDKWTLMLRANYYGSHYDERGTIGGTPVVDDMGNNVVIDRTAEIDPVVYIDLEINYEVTEALQLTLGGSNIFDEFVDEISSDTVMVDGESESLISNRTSVGLQYPRRTAANYEGGSWYLRGTYSF